MSWWRHQGRCMGRVLHFLYHYCGLDVAEHATIGQDVTYRGKRIATIAWSESFGEADVPVFTFEGERADRWMAAQTEKREAAIIDALPQVHAGEHEAVSPAVLCAVDPQMYRSARLWSQCVARTEPCFAVANKVLYCRAGEHWFYWHRECGAWLRAAAPEDA